MYDIFADIQGHLTYSRKQGRALADKFLTEFESAWRHQGSDWKAPDWWEQQYRALEKKGKEHTVTAGNVTMNVDEHGAITLRQGSNVIQVTAEDRTKFSVAMRGLPLGFGGQTSAPSHTYSIANDDRPIMRERMKQNLDAMERWAKASATSFPNFK